LFTYSPTVSSSRTYLSSPFIHSPTPTFSYSNNLDSDSPFPSPIPIITLDSDSPSTSPTSSEINEALEEFVRDLPDLEEESYYLEYHIDPEELTN